MFSPQVFRKFRLIHLRFVVLAITALWLGRAEAATRTWDGGGGASKNWNTAANWSGNTVPVNGDTVVFNNIYGRTTNNIPSLTNFNLRCTSGGNEIYGNNPVSLSGLYTVNYDTNLVTDINIIHVDLVLLQNLVHQDQNIDPRGPGCLITGDIDLNGRTLTVSNYQTQTEYSGVISGAGNLVLLNPNNDDSRLTLSGTSANTYTGTTTVNGGSLNLLKKSGVVGLVAVPGPLIIGGGTGTEGEVVEEAAGQIAATTVTINSFGTLDLNDFNDTIGSLVISNGTVRTGTGILTLASNLTGLAGATMSGNLAVSASDGHVFDIPTGVILNMGAVLSGLGNLTKTGAGTLTLSGSNTFSGTLTNAAGTIRVENPLGLGSTSGPTIVAGGTLWLFDEVVGGEPVTLNSSANLLGSGNSSLAGPVTVIGSPTLSVPSAANNLTLSGVIGGTGGFFSGGNGTVHLSGSAANNFSGGVTVLSGTLSLEKNANVTAIPGNLIIGGSSGGLNSDTVVLTQAGQIADSSVVTIPNSGLLNLNGQNDSVSNIVISGGHIQTGAGTLTLLGSLTVGTTTNTALIEGRLSFGNAYRLFSISDNAVDPDLDLRANLLSTGGSGGWIKSGPGSILVSGTNTYNGDTVITNGVVYVTSSAALGSASGATAIGVSGSLYLRNVTISNESLYLDSFGAPGFAALDATNTSAWNGPIEFQSSATTVGAKTNSTLTLNGDLSGIAVGFTKTNAGNVIIGPGGIGSCDGPTTIAQGALLVNGVFSTSPIQVLAGTGLGGTGTVGTVTSSGTIFPGAYSNGASAGVFTADLVTTTGGKISFDVGTSTGSHDKFKVSSLTLSGGTALEIFKFADNIGAKYTIISNLSASPISGTFNGMPDNSILTVAGGTFLLDYNGGDGNDVAITQAEIGDGVVTIDPLKSLGGGKWQLDLNAALAGYLYSVETSTNLTQWTNVLNIVADPSALVRYTATNSLTDPKRFYRVRSR